MEYVNLTEENLDKVVHNYIDYYNSCEDGCWTYEKSIQKNSSGDDD